MKTNIEQLLENYLYDINIFDNIYITLSKNKIDINGENYNQFTYDVMDIENTKYYIIIYVVGKNTILTIIENETEVNSQFLIKSEKALNNLKIDDLTKHIAFQVADLVTGYFN